MIAPGLMAVCRRCRALGIQNGFEMGDVQINIWDYAFATPAGIVKRNDATEVLIYHHDKFRELIGITGAELMEQGNHTDFELWMEFKLFGNISVAVYGSEHRVWIDNRHYVRKFTQEIENEQRRRGIGPYGRR
jgi:hypothetical protein